jgi:hypothetical protein
MNKAIPPFFRFKVKKFGGMTKGTRTRPDMENLNAKRELQFRSDANVVNVSDFSGGHEQRTCPGNFSSTCNHRHLARHAAAQIRMESSDRSG